MLYELLRCEILSLDLQCCTRRLSFECICLLNSNFADDFRIIDMVFDSFADPNRLVTREFRSAKLQIFRASAKMSAKRMLRAHSFNATPPPQIALALNVVDILLMYEIKFCSTKLSVYHAYRKILDAGLWRFYLCLSLISLTTQTHQHKHQHRVQKKIVRDRKRENERVSSEHGHSTCIIRCLHAMCWLCNTQ